MSNKQILSLLKAIEPAKTNIDINSFLEFIDSAYLQNNNTDILTDFIIAQDQGQVYKYNIPSLIMNNYSFIKEKSYHIVENIYSIFPEFINNQKKLTRKTEKEIPNIYNMYNNILKDNNEPEQKWKELLNISNVFNKNIFVKRIHLNQHLTIKILEQFKNKNQKDFESYVYKHNLIHKSCEYSAEKLIQYFYECGLNLQHLDHKQKTPLFYITNPTVFLNLKKLAPNMKINWEIEDENKKTLFHHIHETPFLIQEPTILNFISTEFFKCNNSIANEQINLFIIKNIKEYKNKIKFNQILKTYNGNINNIKDDKKNNILQIAINHKKYTAAYAILEKYADDEMLNHKNSENNTFFNLAIELIQNKETDIPARIHLLNKGIEKELHISYDFLLFYLMKTIKSDHRVEKLNYQHLYTTYDLPSLARPFSNEYPEYNKISILEIILKNSKQEYLTEKLIPDLFKIIEQQHIKTSDCISYIGYVILINEVLLNKKQIKKEDFLKNINQINDIIQQNITQSNTDRKYLANHLENLDSLIEHINKKYSTNFSFTISALQTMATLPLEPELNTKYFQKILDLKINTSNNFKSTKNKI